MNEYMRIAREYFEEFEGLKLYPSPKSALFWITLVLFIAWGSALVFAISAGHRLRTWSPQMGLFLGAEIGFLVAWLHVQNAKALMTTRRLQQRDQVQTDNLDDLKRAALHRLTGSGPQHFLTMAEECSRLLRLKSDFRLDVNDGFASRFAKRIYDPDSKARLVAITLSSFALFVALLPKTGLDRITLIGVLMDPGVHRIIAALEALAIMGFVVWIALQRLWQEIFDSAKMWFMRLFRPEAGSNVALRYFVNDLIRLHAPVFTSEERHVGPTRVLWRCKPRPHR